MSNRNRVPRSKQSFRQDRFRWTSRSGVTIDLPALHTLSLNDLSALQEAKGVDAVTGIADSETAKEAMRNLALIELQRLTDAWTADGKSTLTPKSGASSIS